MKGTNCLHLCPATMIDIVQEWVDRNIATKPEVTSVVSRSPSSMSDSTFVVTLADTPRKIKPETER